jgi:hypothetical protein
MRVTARVSPKPSGNLATARFVRRPVPFPFPAIAYYHQSLPRPDRAYGKFFDLASTSFRTAPMGPGIGETRGFSRLLPLRPGGGRPRVKGRHARLDDWLEGVAHPALDERFTRFDDPTEGDLPAFTLSGLL